MKIKVLLFFFSLMILSCSTESEGTQYVLSTVEDVTMPTSYKVDSISKIQVKYRRPTDCDIFDGFYYTAEGSTRTVAIQFARLDQSGCVGDDMVYEIPLSFKPTAPGTYVFKFWHATDSNGQSQYIEREAVVPE